MADKIEKVMCGANGLGIACGGALSIDGVILNSGLQSNATLGGGRKMNNMKKLMIAASAALCAAVGFSDVTSANVVGYNTIQIHEEWTILSVNFSNVAGGNLSLGEAFPAVEGMAQDADSNLADQIQIQDGEGGYATYYLSNGKNSKDQQILPPGTWVDIQDASTAATAKLAPGTAFWYLSRNYKTPFNVTVAGGVVMDASKSVNVNGAWTHIANPYPFALGLNGGIGKQDGMTEDADSNFADQIQIQDGEGGYATYYLSNGKNSKDQQILPAGTWVNIQDASTAANATIPVGKGAWYLRRGKENFTITVNSPFGK